MPDIQVTKASGLKQAFDQAKIRQSLTRAGAKPEVIDKILTQLLGKLYDGISTRDIYQQVFALFNQYQGSHSYRYSLKDALMQLGPSGYPFEKFVARLLDHLGFKTKIQVIAQGKCISHEIDVVAEKDQQRFMVECKFHNRAGTKTRSKDALYIQARFEDLGSQFHQPWLITNTKLTANAIKYGQCQNMKLLAWRYPDKESLEQLIEQNQLHPLTCLPFLDLHDRQLLYRENLVLCKDLFKLNSKQLQDLGFSSDKVKQIFTLHSTGFS